MALQVINHNMNLQTALIINTLSKVSLDRQNRFEHRFKEDDDDDKDDKWLEGSELINTL